MDGTTASGGEMIIVDTYWENWTAGARSHDHAFRGTIDDWLYEYVAGIQNTSVAYRDIQVKPYLVGDLTKAWASIETVMGTVSSAWTLDGGNLTLKVVVPVGSSATVMVPVSDGQTVDAPRGAVAGEVADGYASFTVGSGEYSFTAAS